LTVLENIDIEFKHIDYGQSTISINPDSNSKDYNNFEVKISYNNKSVKIPYCYQGINLKGIMSDAMVNMCKMDLIGRIHEDSYPFKSVYEIKSCLDDKGFKQQPISFYEQLFEDALKQSEKYRTLFTENDLKALKLELADWLDSHPNESKSLRSLLEIKN